VNERNYWFSVEQLASVDKRYKGAKDGGWVYVFRNPNHKKLMFKIGETSRPPFQRLQELSSSTGVPIPYQAVYFICVRDRRRAERWVHDQLKEHRVSHNKEFFEAPLSEVIRVMDIAVRHFSDILLPQPFEPEIIGCRSCQTKNKIKRVGIAVRFRCNSCGEYLSL
jgi:hypothetical protein